MPKRKPKTQDDPSVTAAKLVRAALGGGKVRGESLLGSPELKQRLTEAKEAESERAKRRRAKKSF